MFSGILRCLLLSAGFFAAAGTLFAQAPGPHPLDPLTPDEISAAVEILKVDSRISDSTRFSTIVLREPPKEEVLAFKPGNSIRREALVISYERALNKTFEGVIDLSGRKVISWRQIPGVQPSFMFEDIVLLTTIVRSDPEWQMAMRKRGITDFANVQIDAWSAGYFGFPGEAGRRLARGICFYRPRGDRNPYPHPIEGVVAVVDLNAKKMLRLEDTGVVPVPGTTAELTIEANPPFRELPKPLQIVQQNGPSFEINGNQIKWQNWRFRYALHPREGLVLYTVGYEDKGRLRPIMYRGALSEMVVPYGDPSSGWFIRNAFDEGEYGIGVLSLQLEEKTDVPDNAVLRNAYFPTERGNIQTKNRVVAIYERDGGVLWKHVDWVTNRNESRRARELVLSSFSNVGNYEYGFNWVFHQDGSLEMEVLLTGIMAVRAVAHGMPGATRHEAMRFGHIVAPGIEAVHHQHFFNFRLDLDVDGNGGNSVVEQNTRAMPAGKENPQNNAFTMSETVLKRELEGRRQLNLVTNRRWKVVNSKITNDLGLHPGYLLMPGENSISFAGVNSMVRKRAGFMTNHLWATRYDSEEINAAGRYINQSPGGDGLAKWTSQNRSILGQDVVIWYSMGITHIPRPEDWPVMPVHKAGFKLLPNAFFTSSPAMDVPK